MPVSIVRRTTRLVALLSISLAAAACGDRADAPFRVAFETSRGNFVVEVKPSLAPLGAQRFRQLVDSGYFTDARFFRVLPGFVAQFGMHADPKVNAMWSEKTIADDPVIESNKRGTIVFATRGPNTRSNQFFINFGDNAMLDGQGFSPFGHVVEGMEVVDAIHSGYGDAPSQGQIAAEGNAYLMREFPQLDYIKSAKVVK